MAKAPSTDETVYLLEMADGTEQEEPGQLVKLVRSNLGKR